MVLMCISPSWPAVRPVALKARAEGSGRRSIGIRRCWSRTWCHSPARCQGELSDGRVSVHEVLRVCCRLDSLSGSGHGPYISLPC